MRWDHSWVKGEDLFSSEVRALEVRVCARFYKSTLQKASRTIKAHLGLSWGGGTFADGDNEPFAPVLLYGETTAACWALLSLEINQLYCWMTVKTNTGRVQSSDGAITMVLHWIKILKSRVTNQALSKVKICALRFHRCSRRAWVVATQKAEHNKYGSKFPFLFPEKPTQAPDLCDSATEAPW